MNVWDEISEIVKDNLDLFGEIERSDTAMRRPLGADERREKMPWIMVGRDYKAKEELDVWRLVNSNSISNAEALARIRGLMQEYYGS